MNVWILTWKYSDNSDGGVYSVCYQDEKTAQHILDAIRASDPEKDYSIMKLEVAKGRLE